MFIKIAGIKGKQLNIQLEKKVYDLTEVNIKPKDALEIIKQAIAKIPENYPTQPINMEGFYREMTFENDTCVEMAEAACEFYYRPYNEEYNFKEALNQMYKYTENHHDYFFSISGKPLLTNPKDRLNIIEARASGLNHKQRFKVVPKGGPVGLTTWDVTKNKSLFLSTKSLRRSKRYKLINITTYNNKQVYVISYKGHKGYMYNSGKIYIDIKTLAFVAFEIQSPAMNFRTTYYWTPALYTKKRRRCKDYEVLKKEVININYKEINGKWYLSSIHHQFEFDYVFSKFYRYKKIQDKISYKINKDLLIK